LRPLRLILYLMGLAWSFLGVAIIADVFMGAIEKITSKKTRKLDKERNRYVTVTVWNSTVANLTLMALGSSAPEILLNCIEIVADDFYLGGLGPSTIVGSAAFNLLVIIAVCVASIPAGEVRAIKEVGVYWLTAVWSLLAYIWLLVMVLGTSKYVIEVWEGVLTFLFFPLLVGSAYLMDRGYFGDWGGGSGSSNVLAAELSKEELAELELRIIKEHGPNLTSEQITKFVQIECGDKLSRAKYRIAATRGITGGRRIHTASRKAGEMIRSMSSGFSSKKKVVPVTPEEKALVEFAVFKHAVLESAGSVTVTVTRKGLLSLPVTVQYATREGSAKKGTDYEHTEGVLTFAPSETEQQITVRIVDDVTYEEDEEFYIDLAGPQVRSSDRQEVELGNKTITVMIVDDDMPGSISFVDEETRIQEKEEDSEVSLGVQRCHGSSGKVICMYHTEDDTARAGVHYESKSGELCFENTQMSAVIKVPILATGRYDRMEQFRVILEWPEDDKKRGGAKFDPDTDGGAECCIMTCIIEGGGAHKARVDSVMQMLQDNWAKASVGSSSWADQFREAIQVNGGDDDDDEEGDGGKASIIDWILHIVSLPWKLLFALCPPTDYCGGWGTFVTSLFFIGLVTALISDLAHFVGCTLGICDSITAITFVALGTSLPDTFASKTAAQQDPTADASIVNVTGSNSVNVFLGLGLPWMTAALKWHVGGATASWTARYGNDPDIAAEFRTNDGARFVVKDESLAYSVMVFTCCAIVCIVLLSVRRLLFGGELGGPELPKWGTSGLLVCLWISYVSISSAWAECDT